MRRFTALFFLFYTLITQEKREELIELIEISEWKNKKETAQIASSTEFVRECLVCKLHLENSDDFPELLEEFPKCTHFMAKK